MKRCKKSGMVSTRKAPTPKPIVEGLNMACAHSAIFDMFERLTLPSLCSRNGISSQGSLRLAVFRIIAFPYVV